MPAIEEPWLTDRRNFVFATHYTRFSKTTIQSRVLSDFSVPISNGYSKYMFCFCQPLSLHNLDFPISVKSYHIEPLSCSHIITLTGKSYRSLLRPDMALEK